MRSLITNALLVVVLFRGSQLDAHPANRYVNFASRRASAPYTTWETAAPTLQTAVDAATSAGATLWISNGVYQTVGSVTVGTTADQVSITKPLKLRSVNGPKVTIIDGGGNTRCLHLSDPNISIGGLTLTNGNAGGEEGGGAGFCVLNDSLVTANSAVRGGGRSCPL